MIEHVRCLTRPSQTCGLFVGPMLDRAGPRALVVLGSTIMFAGMLLFGASDSVTFDAFIPAFLLIAIGGGSLSFVPVRLGACYYLAVVRFYIPVHRI